LDLLEVPPYSAHGIDVGQLGIGVVIPSVSSLINYFF